MRYDTIMANNLAKGIKEAVANSQESIQKKYLQSTRSLTENSTYDKLVNLCALLTNEDSEDAFTKKDIIYEAKKKSIKINEQSLAYYLNKLCEQNRGTLLEKFKIGSTAYFRFCNPLVKSFILLTLYEKGEINESYFRNR